MVLASGIVKVSRALKSTSAKRHAGSNEEDAVITLLQSRKWILCFQSLKTSVAEIDLIFEKDGKVLLIEVKRLNNSWRAFQRIHNDQLLKLKKNVTWISLKFPAYECRGFVAWVDEKNRISFVDIN